MRNILVPLDSSPFSEQALPMAFELAERTGATVHLVHVQEPPATPYWFDGTTSFDPAAAELLRTESARYLEDIAAQYAAADGVATMVRLLEAPIVEAITEYAHGNAIDVIVMTTHGRGGISRLWLGSVADELIRAIDVPLLLLHPRALYCCDDDCADARDASDASDDYAAAQAPIVSSARHVLLPLDGSALAEAAFAPAVSLATIAGARLTLLRVVSPTHAAGRVQAPVARLFEAAGYRAERAQAEQYLNDMAQRVPLDVGDVRTVVVSSTEPAHAVRRYSVEESVDLIVIATHGRSGVARWALGSIADKLIRSGTAAVLVVRPGSGGGLAAWQQDARLEMTV
jgi:nucleotide-binding universal stress UspA family protein